MIIKNEMYRLFNDVFRGKEITKWIEGHEGNIPAYSLIQSFTHRKLIAPEEMDVLPKSQRDFILCWNLMSNFPFWFSHIELVNEKYPDWRHFFTNWNRLLDRMDDKDDVEEFIGKIRSILNYHNV